MDNLSDAEKGEIVEQAKKAAGIVTQEALEMRSCIKSSSRVIGWENSDIEVLVSVAIVKKGTFLNETEGGGD